MEAGGPVSCLSPSWIPISSSIKWTAVMLVKQRKCRELVKALVLRHEAVISTQILQEFYVACTTKLKIKPILVKGMMHGFENMEVVTVGPDLINEAVDTSIQYHISFWDSLVIVSDESA